MADRVVEFIAWGTVLMFVAALIGVGALVYGVI